MLFLLDSSTNRHIEWYIYIKGYQTFPSADADMNLIKLAGTEINKMKMIKCWESTCIWVRLGSRRIIKLLYMSEFFYCHKDLEDACF